VDTQEHRVSQGSLVAQEATEQVVLAVSLDIQGLVVSAVFQVGLELLALLVLLGHLDSLGLVDIRDSRGLADLAVSAGHLERQESADSLDILVSRGIQVSLVGLVTRVLAGIRDRTEINMKRPRQLLWRLGLVQSLSQ
jgi:hypothetical protein